MKIQLIALLFVLPFMASAEAASTCSKIEALESSQYADSDDGISYLKDGATLIADAAFSGGYTDVPVYRTCMILGDGRIATVSSQGNRKTCTLRRMKKDDLASLKSELDLVRMIPVTTTPYGWCDLPSYSIMLSEQDRMTDIESVHDCGDRMQRKDPMAEALVQRILKICRSGKVYREIREDTDGATDDFEAGARNE